MFISVYKLYMWWKLNIFPFLEGTDLIPAEHFFNPNIKSKQLASMSGYWLESVYDRNDKCDL